MCSCERAVTRSPIDRTGGGCEEAIDAAPSHSADDHVETEVSALRDAVRAVLNQLDERDRSVISLRFGLRSRQKAITLDDVVNRLGISRERARQHEVRAMARVRSFATAAKLDEYLD